VSGTVARHVVTHLPRIVSISISSLSAADWKVRHAAALMLAQLPQCSQAVKVELRARNKRYTTEIVHFLSAIRFDQVRLVREAVVDAIKQYDVLTGTSATATRDAVASKPPVFSVGPPKSSSSSPLATNNATTNHHQLNGSHPNCSSPNDARIAQLREQAKKRNEARKQMREAVAKARQRPKSPKANPPTTNTTIATAAAANDDDDDDSVLVIDSRRTIPSTTSFDTAGTDVLIFHVPPQATTTSAHLLTSSNSNSNSNNNSSSVPPTKATPISNRSFLQTSDSDCDSESCDLASNNAIDHRHQYDYSSIHDIESTFDSSAGEDDDDNLDDNLNENDNDSISNHYDEYLNQPPRSAMLCTSNSDSDDDDDDESTPQLNGTHLASTPLFHATNTPHTLHHQAASANSVFAGDLDDPLLSRIQEANRHLDSLYAVCCTYNAIRRSLSLSLATHHTLPCRTRHAFHLAQLPIRHC
jgi:hypothetical protein